MVVRFVCVGMRYYGGHRFSEGDVISLAKDPENPVDSGAIKVLANGKHVGFVAREHTKGLSSIPIDKQVFLVETYPNSVLLEMR